MTEKAQDAALEELLCALDELYPLPDDDRRAERGGRTAAVLKQWLRRETEAIAEIAIGMARGMTPMPVGGAAQRLYDATTLVISYAPTGRTDLGATKEYHDALLDLTILRDELRRGGAIVHDETYWKRYAQPPLPAPVKENE